MKILHMIFNNIKNFLPYLLIVTTYFFLVNFDARNKQTNKRINNNEKLNNYNRNFIDRSIRINIPVIPYKKNNSTL